MRFWGRCAFEFRWFLALLLLVPFLLFTGASVKSVPWPVFSVKLAASHNQSRSDLKALEFTVCSFSAQCDEGRPLVELLPYVGAHARELAARRVEPVLLHIGSVDETKGEAPSWNTDLDIFGKLLAPLPQELLNVLRLVFVEPSIDRVELIWENVRRLPVSESQVEVINAVVRGRCIERPTETETQHRFSEEAEQAFNVSFAVYKTWRGTTTWHLLDTLITYVSSAGRRRWRNFLFAQIQESYQELLKVPCYTPTQLLREANTSINVSSLSMVVVQNSASDAIESLLDLPLFRPGYFQFNYRTMGRPRTEAVHEALQNRGFVVGGTLLNEEFVIALSSNLSLPPTAASAGSLVKPHFSACDTPEPCGPEGSAWKYQGDLFNGSGLAASEVTSHCRLPRVMLIGSGDLTSKVPFLDLDLHMKVAQSVPPAFRSELRFLFVDPNVDVLATAVRSAMHLPIPPGNLEAFVTKVSVDCPPNINVTWRFFSRRVVQKFGKEAKLMTEDTTNTSKKSLMKRIREATRLGKSSDDDAGWRALLNSSNLSAHIAPGTIPCLEPSALIAAVGANINDVITLVVNAENDTAGIVRSLLKWPRFKPAYFQFAEGSRVDETQALFRALHRSGFHAGKTYPRLSTAKNIVAVPFNSRLVRLEPRFSVCDLPKPCGPDKKKWRHLQELLQSARSVVEEQWESHGAAQPPVFLQLGGKDMAYGQGGPFSAMELHSAALGVLPQRLQQSVRLAVVHPIEHVQHKIWARMPFNLSLAKYVTALVLDDYLSDNVTRYHIKPEAERDFGVPSIEFSSWLSTTKSEIVRLIESAAHATRDEHLVRKWSAFVAAANRSAYIAEVTVPRLNISAALSRAGTAVDGLAMVVIDSSEPARPLVSSMLESESFRPGFLQFGLSDLDSWGSQVLLHKLHDQGFAIGLRYPEGALSSGLPHVVVAVRTL